MLNLADETMTFMVAIVIVSCENNLYKDHGYYAVKHSTV